MPRFDLRFDVPSECARLLHAGAIDVGLIPSIEYLRGRRAVRASCRTWRSRRAGRSPRSRCTRERDPRDIRSIAMDTQLADVGGARDASCCARVFGIDGRGGVDGARPRRRCWRSADAALIIGDIALFSIRSRCSPTDRAMKPARDPHPEDRPRRGVDGDDRAAVRLCVLGRAGRSADAGRRRGAAAGARRRRRRTPTRSRGRISGRSGARRRWRCATCGIISGTRLGDEEREGLRTVLSLRGGARAGRAVRRRRLRLLPMAERSQAHR